MLFYEIDHFIEYLIDINISRLGRRGSGIIEQIFHKEFNIFDLLDDLDQDLPVPLFKIELRKQDLYRDFHTGERISYFMGKPGRHLPAHPQLLRPLQLLHLFFEGCRHVIERGRHFPEFTMQCP